MSNPKDLVGAKKAPLRYVPAALVIEASGPMEDGALKYGPFNWRDIPVEVMTYIEAVQRHLAAFVDGQDNAEDSGHSHIGHAIAGLGIIADAKANGTLIDNRPTKGPAADMLRARDKSAKPVIEAAFGRLVTERFPNGESRSAIKMPGIFDPITGKYLCGHTIGEIPESDCGTLVHPAMG